MVKWMGLEIPFWLLVAIGVGLVLLLSFQSPSTLSTSDSHHARRTRGRNSSTKQEKKEKESPPASEAAKDVARRLGVSVPAAVGAAAGRSSKRRVPVTVCVNDVVLRKDIGGEWVAIESAVRVLALLNEVASVFLVAWVDTDVDESLVKDLALLSGLVSPAGTAAMSLGALAGNATGIPEHRLLFCSSHIGQVAVVRQLAPSLHIGGPILLLEGISRFVPTLLRIDPSAIELPPPGQEKAALPATEPDKQPPTTSTSTSGSNNSNNSDNNNSSSNSRGGGYSLEWREFKSLAAAAGLPPSVTPATESSSSKGVGHTSTVVEDCRETKEPICSRSSSTSSVEPTAVELAVEPTTAVESTAAVEPTTRCGATSEAPVVNEPVLLDAPPVNAPLVEAAACASTSTTTTPTTATAAAAATATATPVLDSKGEDIDQFVSVATPLSPSTVAT